MQSEGSTLQDVLDRLEKFEKQNRRLKQFGGTALVVVAAVMLMGQAPATRTVEANEFVLKEANGKVRARLSMTAFGPAFALLDVNGKVRVRLAVPEDVAGLALLDANGKARVELGAGADANLFTMKDADGSVRAGLFVGDEVYLRLVDANGKPRVMLDVREDGPDLSLLDTSGKAAAGLRVNTGGTRLQLADTEGFQTTIGSTDLVTPRTGETRKTSAASVILFDKEKNVLWKAP